MKKKTAEKDIENYLAKRAKEESGLYYKFISPGNSGVPDRILILKGLTIFIELKAPGEKPRELQVAVINQMKKRGAIVYVFDSKDQIDEMFFGIQHNQLNQSN